MTTTDTRQGRIDATTEPLEFAEPTGTTGRSCSPRPTIGNRLLALPGDQGRDGDGEEPTNIAA